MTEPPGEEPDPVRAPDPRMISVTPSTRLGRPGEGAGYRPVRRADDAGDAGVRPFVVTGGRTAPRARRLRVEAQVVTLPGVSGTGLDAEHRRIVVSCRNPLSVAEIAAAVALPLGVVRVLLADLEAAGFITVRESGRTTSRATVERLLEGLHAL